MHNESKHTINALAQLQSALFDLSAVVTSLVWGSNAVNLHDPRLSAIETSMAKARDEINKLRDAAAQPQEVKP